MYNPVNMKIEDETRLYEKDLREKNKKARFEVKYDVEALIRKEGLAEQDRLHLLKLNKISGLRFKEETERGFDILTNSKLEGPATTLKQDQVSSSGPVKVWKNALYAATQNDQVDEQMKKLAEEEYYAKLKERGVNAEFKKTELEKLGALGPESKMDRTFYETRSRRLLGGDYQQAPVSKQASTKQASLVGSQQRGGSQVSRLPSKQASITGSQAAPVASRASSKAPVSI